MTWIVGVAFPDYVLGISDIRVRFSDRSERDCLQKIYPIAEGIAAGFAGPVDIGFRLLDELRYILSETGRSSEEVVNRFPELARKVFHSSQGLHHQQAHLMLLVAGNVGKKSFLGPPNCSVCILKSPDFNPEIAAPSEVVSIGIGSEAEQYKHRLRSYSKNPIAQFRFQRDSNPLLVRGVTTTIQRDPVQGISVHLHVCFVQPDEIPTVANNDDEVCPPELRVPAKLRARVTMPQVCFALFLPSGEIKMSM